MREIKVRFWLKNVKAMMSQEDMHQCCIEGDYNFLEVLTCQESSVTPMLCTGLKDKNGVDVYEGDVVEIVRHDGELRCNCEVKFNNGKYKFDGAHDVAFTDSAYSFKSDIVEVIGNIHQNPELLRD